jgi:CNT family concentrative nucleoside transporter
LSELWLRGPPVLGLLAMLGVAWLCSEDRRRVPWRTVGFGLALQLVLALLLLRSAGGRLFFGGVNDAVNAVVAYTGAGVGFVLGPIADTGFSIFANVLPIIVFMGSLFAVLYHLGVVQRVVDVLAAVLVRTLGTSGAESLAAVANIFIGMTEAPLLVRPYLERMTRSELFTLMTTGMATVAGSVMVAYATMLGGGDFPGHLLTASLLSAPAGIVIAKLMVPETEVAETAGAGHAAVPRETVNVIDAASRGALDGLRLAAYIGALLVAFVALVALANGLLGALGAWVGVPGLSFERVFGWVFAPAAWLLGIPWADAPEVGALLGVKTVLNEFLAYQDLAELMAAGAIGERSAVIASYALCGFANFGSVAILLGGMGGLAPSRRGDLARFGLRSILSGTLACLMTACFAGLLL